MEIRCFILFGVTMRQYLCSICRKPWNKHTGQEMFNCGLRKDVKKKNKEWRKNENA